MMFHRLASILTRLAAAAFVLCAMVGVFAACSSAPPKPSVALNAAQYTYSEPEGAKTNVTMALVNMHPDGDLGLKLSQLKQIRMQAAGLYVPNVPLCYADFEKAFNSNFRDMFIAKGMNTRGPFRDVNEMTFPEKKESDFVIIPQLTIDYAQSTLAPPKAQWSNVRYEYRIAITGELTVAIHEPLSNEKFWVKRIAFPAFSKDIVANTEDLENSSINACNEAFIAFFNEVMTKTSRYISAEEIALLKQQSQEIRRKKVY